MYGKVVNLDKPLILLKKTKQKINEISDDEDEKMDGGHETNENVEKSTRTEYLISAVIRKKFLFNKRPRPIVYLGAKQIN